MSAKNKGKDVREGGKKRQTECLGPPRGRLTMMATLHSRAHIAIVKKQERKLLHIFEITNFKKGPPLSRQSSSHPSVTTPIICD